MSQNPLAIAISAIVAILIAAGGVVVWTLRLAVAPRPRRDESPPPEVAAVEQAHERASQRVTDADAEAVAALDIDPAASVDERIRARVDHSPW